MAHKIKPVLTHYITCDRVTNDAEGWIGYDRRCQVQTLHYHDRIHMIAVCLHSGWVIFETADAPYETIYLCPEHTKYWREYTASL